MGLAFFVGERRACRGSDERESVVCFTLSRGVYILFSLLALVFGVLFLLVAALSAFGIVAMLKANKRNLAYLEASEDEAPLQLDHLSGPLRRLVQDTRLLRISLEGPIRDVLAMRTGEFAQSAGADMEAFDSMLMNVTREVADWVEAAARLSEDDRARIEDLGVSTHRVQHLLDAEGGAFERRHLHRAGAPPLDARLQGLAAELTKLEQALQSTSRVYR